MKQRTIIATILSMALGFSSSRLLAQTDRSKVDASEEVLKQQSNQAVFFRNKQAIDSVLTTLKNNPSPGARIIVHAPNTSKYVSRNDLLKVKSEGVTGISMFIAYQGNKKDLYIIEAKKQED
jgi:hypothetical protein